MKEVVRILTASVSGVIKPRATVSFQSVEEVTTKADVVAILGIRKSLFSKYLSLGAPICPEGFTGKLTIQLHNRSDEEIEIMKGDEIANVVYLQSALAQMQMED